MTTMCTPISVSPAATRAQSPTATRSRGGPSRAGGIGLLGLAVALLLLVVAPTTDPVAGQDWPSFRGPGASGVADGQDLPVRFDSETGEHLLFQVPIPGLAHSSPIVAGERLYVTTAISSRDDADFKHGLYGEGTASDDRTEHRFVVQALDKRSGRELWTTVVHRGVPEEKRHIKATYNNQTPATDGAIVVAFFGSEGLYALDAATGELLWQRDLGTFDVGAYDAPTYEWGAASSPIVWQGRVFVQADTQDEDFVMALDLETGETLWKTERDELPSWGTPTIVEGPERVELVTNASNLIRGYDPRTGEELWRLGGSSQITAPTPIHDGDGRIVVASGRRPVKPIFVIRAGSHGDLTLAEDETSSEAIVWSRRGRGSYMPTPIVYDGILYSLNNDGILDAYRLADGTELYRQRTAHQGGGFSGSPVASDGRLYLASEDGDVLVVRAGPEYELLEHNEIGERIMTTPAISDGVLYIKGRSHLFAFAKPAVPSSGSD